MGPGRGEEQIDLDTGREKDGRKDDQTKGGRNEKEMQKESRALSGKVCKAKRRGRKEMQERGGEIVVPVGEKSSLPVGVAHPLSFCLKGTYLCGGPVSTHLPPVHKNRGSTRLSPVRSEQ